jgi:hypothetical protein
MCWEGEGGGEILKSPVRGLGCGEFVVLGECWFFFFCENFFLLLSAWRD